ncbi:hypothetical protein Oweho_0588 [Owenweeksia hongkongensis DSM 17368]|uniref:Uncharacterized protein n=1 Tax=Owenweeksia hongkongensis (strain DSM 17368 / CIP 108786 / JCM 12287 / NRRL B-23963 / UST20020801) TaxID=926562 RepID=G8R0E4_OWEHD|nr:hypothetical protein [Owenweeksia hongkongensis]AEV31604.1 hypothetical protein Oweho_0588 [Owenweeksia hongkongensis DSM 17368]
MKTYTIFAALIVGSVLLASECQCDNGDDPDDRPTDEMVMINTLD